MFQERFLRTISMRSGGLAWRVTCKPYGPWRHGRARKTRLRLFMSAMTTAIASLITEMESSKSYVTMEHREHAPWGRRDLDNLTEIR